MSDPKQDEKKEQKQEEAPKQHKKNEEKAEKQEMKSLESWAFELRIASWQLAALKKANKFATGKVVSRDEFEKALQTALNKKF